jgi:cell division protein FtsL
MFTVFQLLQPNVSAVVLFVLFFLCSYGVVTSNVFSDLFFNRTQQQHASNCEQQSSRRVQVEQQSSTAPNPSKRPGASIP